MEFLMVVVLFLHCVRIAVLLLIGEQITIEFILVR